MINFNAFKIPTDDPALTKDTWQGLINEMITLNESFEPDFDRANKQKASLTIRPNKNDGDFAALELGADKDKSWIQSKEQKPLVINPEGGNVGIGTSVPETRLHIAHTSGEILTGQSAYGGLHLEQKGGNDKFVGITADASNTGTGTQSGILFQGSGRYGTKMHFLTTETYADGMKQRMIIDHLGNVGIGTTSPSMSLEVTQNSLWNRPSIGASFGSNRWAYLHVGSSAHSLIWNKGSSMRFGSEASKGAGYTEHMRIDENGLLTTSTPLIMFKTYANLGDNIDFDTRESTNVWNAGIVGFQTPGADIQEGGHGTFIKLYMHKKRSKWHICADLRTHSGHDENWTVHVMFVRKSIST